MKCDIETPVDDICTILDIIFIVGMCYKHLIWKVVVYLYVGMENEMLVGLLVVTACLTESLWTVGGLTDS